MRKLLLLVLSATMLFGMSAFAQDVKVLRTNVPFDFMAGEKQLPAGTYDVKVTDNTRMVQLTNIKTKDVAMVQVMTRLAADPNHSSNTLSFDVIGGKHMLETYWPKTGDGFLLHATPDTHTHKTLKAS